MFDHFLGLALKGPRSYKASMMQLFCRNSSRLKVVNLWLLTNFAKKKNLRRRCLIYYEMYRSSLEVFISYRFVMGSFSISNSFSKSNCSLSISNSIPISNSISTSNSFHISSFSLISSSIPFLC